MKQIDSDGTYSSRNPVVRSYFSSRLMKMAQIADSLDPQIMLDIGCGGGELLAIVAKRFTASECVGIDIGDGLYEAKRKIARANVANVQLVRADCAFLPFRSRCLPLVFCASVLEHLQDARPAVLELDRIIESDGRLVIGVPTENRTYRISREIVGLRKPKDHFHQAAHLEALLAHRFDNPRSITLPFSFLPRSLSLYVILVCHKGFDGTANHNTGG